MGSPPRFRLGDLLWVEVVEDLGQGEVIVSLQGKLLRVQNHSPQRLRPGLRLQVQVRQQDPLELRLWASDKDKRRLDRLA